MNQLKCTSMTIKLYPETLCQKKDLINWTDSQDKAFINYGFDTDDEQFVVKVDIIDELGKIWNGNIRHGNDYPKFPFYVPLVEFLEQFAIDEYLLMENDFGDIFFHLSPDIDIETICDEFPVIDSSAEPRTQIINLMVEAAQRSLTTNEEAVVAS